MLNPPSSAGSASGGIPVAGRLPCGPIPGGASRGAHRARGASCVGRSAGLVLPALFAAFALAGCGEEPGIATYTVPKRPPVEIAAPPDHPPAGMAARPVLPPAALGGAPQIEYDVPTGWRKSPGNQFSVAAFAVGDGERTAEITVSAVAGSLAGNINRWRGQVGLSPQTGTQIAQEVEEVSVGDTEGLYIELFGPERDGAQPAILGIVAQAAGRQWFFKFTGDGELARQEKERFREFAKSVRFVEGKGNGDGD